MAKAHPKFTVVFPSSNVRPNAISKYLIIGPLNFCSMEPNQEPELEIDPIKVR
jgi:hypothetical protein